MTTSVYSEKVRQLADIARFAIHKQAAVDAASLMGGGAGMDPAMAGGGGGMPPMDPSMMGGGGGGMPPMDPSMMGGGPPPLSREEVQAMIQQAVAAGGGGAAAGAGGAAAGGLKPKIDVNVEIMQLKNMISKLIDAMGIPVPTQEMVATPEKLTAMAQGAAPGGAAGGAGGGAAAGGGSAIAPIDPMQAASPSLAKAGQLGDAYAQTADRCSKLSGKAAAMADILARRKAN